MLQITSNPSPSRVVALDGELPAAPDPIAVYAASTVAQRDALHAMGALAVFVPAWSSAKGLPDARTLVQGISVPVGTAWLERREVHTALGVTRLSPIDARLLTCLASGDWQDDASLFAAMPPGPRSTRRLHSAVARLRRKLGGGVERAYGRSWRLCRTGNPRGVLLDALASGPPQPMEELARALGCSEAALRVRVHRQRKRGVPIETRDGSYRWPTHHQGMARRLELALASAPLVVLTGPIGVGKTHLARALFQGTMVSLAGEDQGRVRRRLRALAGRPPGRWLLDGLTACDPVRAELVALVDAGHRVLVTARQGLTLPCPSVHVAMPPWEPEALQAAFPGIDVRTWDGLPFAHLPMEQREDHIARALPAGLAQGVAEVVPGEESSLDAATYGSLKALGWLVDGRLPTPLQEALRAGWQGDAWAAHAERLVARLQERFEHGRPLTREAPLAAEAIAVLTELVRWGQPCHALVASLHATWVLREVQWLDRALQEDMSGDERAQLHHARYMLVEDGLDNLRRAVALASPPQAADYEVQLAHALWGIDQGEAIEHFEAVGRWLDTQPPEEHLWVRTDWLVSQVLRDPFRVAPERLLDQLTVVERRRLSGKVPKGRWMVALCSYGIGVAALVRDQLTCARSSLVRVVEMLGPRAIHHGAIDLLMALVRDEAWEEARELWPLVRDAELSPPWHAHRACVRGLWLLARGDIESARELADRIEVDHPSGRPLLAVLAAVDGGQAPAGHEELVALVAAVLAGSAVEADLERLPAGRHLSPTLLRRILCSLAQT